MLWVLFVEIYGWYFIYASENYIRIHRSSGSHLAVSLLSRAESGMLRFQFVEQLVKLQINFVCSLLIYGTFRDLIEKIYSGAVLD